MLVYQRVICEKSILNPSVQLPTLPTWIPGAPPRTFISFVQLRNTRVSAGATEIGLSGSKIVYVYIYAYMYITIYNNNNNNKKNDDNNKTKKQTRVKTSVAKSWCSYLSCPLPT